MRMATVINGITWAHSRGLTPLLATAQRFMELHPDIEIRWKTRSLQAFADMPIEALTQDFDLLIIDHPWVGTADATRCVLPLEEHLSNQLLQQCHDLSAGESFSSYRFNHHQWALPIDAATPVASWRDDLLHRWGISVPTTWQEVLALAQKGKVLAPAIPIDLLMNFYMFAHALKVPIFETLEPGDSFMKESDALAVLETMYEFYSHIPKECFLMNPIQVAEQLSDNQEQFAYCPFSYGYSNYTVKGYAQHTLHYGRLVDFDTSNNSKNILKSTLGGTGIAVSAFSKHQKEALSFVSYVMQPSVQEGIYLHAGGQPGLKNAWISPASNMHTSNYFLQTLPDVEHAYVRPRYHGYLHFQDHAGIPLQQYLRTGDHKSSCFREMNRVFQESLVIRDLHNTNPYKKSERVHESYVEEKNDQASFHSSSVQP